MRILATSDIHGNRVLVHRLLNIAEKLSVDALVLAGDIASKGLYRLKRHGSRYDLHSVFRPQHKRELLEGTSDEICAKLDLVGFIESFGAGFELEVLRAKQTESLKQTCRLLAKVQIPVFMLIGNDDHIRDRDWDAILEAFGIGNLNLQCYPLDGTKLVGFQYVPPTPWNTNNELPEERLAEKLKAVAHWVDTNTILVTHGPPHGVLDGLANGLHVGSPSLLSLLREKRPLFHVFGHIHEAFGHQSLGDTTCCNVACQWAEGCLRAYLLDSQEKSVQSILEQTTVEDLCSALTAEQEDEHAV